MQKTNEIPEKKCSMCGQNQYLWVSENCKECRNWVKKHNKGEISGDERTSMDLAKKMYQKQFSSSSTHKSRSTLYFVLVLIFILWVLFGGIFEKKDNKNIIQIDCSDPINSKYNKFCNGEYQTEQQEMDYLESTKYR